MPVTIYLRSVLGRNLTPTEADANIDNLRDAIDALVASPPSPVEITNITVSGTQFTVVMSDATTWGPFDLPVGGLSDSDLVWHIATITADEYTLTDTDNRYHFLCTHADGCLVSIPDNSAVPLIIGTRIRFTQKSGGDVTVMEDGTTIVLRVPTGRDPTTIARYATIEIEKIGTDEWIIGPYGSLLAANPSISI